jgi:hypothetical protein
MATESTLVLACELCALRFSVDGAAVLVDVIARAFDAEHRSLHAVSVPEPRPAVD